MHRFLWLVLCCFCLSATAGEINILLTFDDGPAAAIDNDPAKSPTARVLDTLAAFRHGERDEKCGVCAVFFVLTAPDKFLHNTHAKGESLAGQNLIREIARRGHLIGVHWGGDYHGQTRTHLADLTPLTPPAQQKLTRQLQSSMDLIYELTGKRPQFVRPPLWKYQDAKNPPRSALPIYEYLNLKMILTDAKYPDGGYKSISRLVPFKERLFVRGLRTAFATANTSDLVITFHDANPQTADHLANALATIKRTYREFFGTTSGLHFVTHAAHAEQILRDKKSFIMFE